MCGIWGKTDFILECVRQLGDIKTYFKISKQKLQQFITEIQNESKRVVESNMYKGNCTKKETEFLLSKRCIYNIPHFYTI